MLKQRKSFRTIEDLIIVWYDKREKYRDDINVLYRMYLSNEYFICRLNSVTRCFY